MKKWIVAALVWPALTYADWKMTPGPNEIEGVNISRGAAIEALGKTYELQTVGAGLRSKKVVFDVKVYVAQLLMSDSAKFVKTPNGALKSLADEQAAAIRLTFVRDVGADTVMSSFQDAFDANKIDQKDADVASFLNDVRTLGDARSGGSIAILIAKQPDGSEVVALENTASNKTTERVYRSGVMEKIMSIWLGVPADSGIQKLKDQLLSGKL